MSSSPVLPVLALVWLPLFDDLDLPPALAEPLVELSDVPLTPPPDMLLPVNPPPMPLGVPPVEPELTPKAGWVEPLLEPEPLLLLLLLPLTLLCTSLGEPPPVPAPMPAVLLGLLLLVSSRLSWLVEPWFW